MHRVKHSLAPIPRKGDNEEGNNLKTIYGEVTETIREPQQSRLGQWFIESKTLSRVANIVHLKEAVKHTVNRHSPPIFQINSVTSKVVFICLYAYHAESKPMILAKTPPF